MVLKNLNDLNVLSMEFHKEARSAAANDQHSLGAVYRAWKENILIQSW